MLRTDRGGKTRLAHTCMALAQHELASTANVCDINFVMVQAHGLSPSGPRDDGDAGTLVQACKCTP